MSETSLLLVEHNLGQPIPLEPHAVSVTLPTWRSNVGYEEGQDWVLSRMSTGYPRFFIQKPIVDYAKLLEVEFGRQGESFMLFPSHNAAERCLDFVLDPTQSVHSFELAPKHLRILDFVPANTGEAHERRALLYCSAVAHSDAYAKQAKTFWQHTGEGISSRRAAYCAAAFQDHQIVLKDQQTPHARLPKGPRRYRRANSNDGTTTLHHEHLDTTSIDQRTFVEERYGRNLDLDLADTAKVAIRRRIAGSQLPADDLAKAVDRTDHEGIVPVADVYLYPGGMNSIFHAHRTMLHNLFPKPRKSICFGFPYIDTLKILEKWGPGCLFYGFGSSEDLDDLEVRLKNGERYLALFTEFPSNPLLRTPDLHRIHVLARRYDFAVVIDETIGNVLNVHTLAFADVQVQSLTKIFSGDSNVMGGSVILNPRGQYYKKLKAAWTREYTDIYWPEDAIFMERNSRDFATRIVRVNKNAEAICGILKDHPRIKQVYYPQINPSRPFYDACRTPDGGYGGLLSATFHSIDDAAAFFDHLDTQKGPSLGTNFTLASPFVLLAHFTELDWAAQYGVEANLVRFSVGLEDTPELIAKFRKALDAIAVDQ